MSQYTLYGLTKGSGWMRYISDVSPPFLMISSHSARIKQRLLLKDLWTWTVFLSFGLLLYGNSFKYLWIIFYFHFDFCITSSEWIMEEIILRCAAFPKRNFWNFKLSDPTLYTLQWLLELDKLLKEEPFLTEKNQEYNYDSHKSTLQRPLSTHIFKILLVIYEDWYWIRGSLVWPV